MPAAPPGRRLVRPPLLVYFVHHPEKRWLSWTLGVAFALMLFFPALGLLVPRPA